MSDGAGRLIVMKRPEKPAREFISPSDLTFGLSTCRRCLWIKYWFKISAPLSMPLVGTLSALQEESFRGVPTSAIDPSLRPGKVTKFGEWVKSRIIEINGEQTRWRILGKYDLIAENEDGTVTLIDCKVSDSDRDSGAFYSPQLEAYAFALENPAAGKAVEVAAMGLLIWKPVSALGDPTLPNQGTGFEVRQSYVPVDRDSDGFQVKINSVISLLEGEMPPSGDNCEQCAFIEKRGSALSE